MLTVNLDKASKNLGHDAGGRTDYKVFTCLTEYMDGNGVSTVPQNIIAEETGFARRTVSNSIHRLQDKSFLTIEKTIKNNTGIAGNIYHINPKYLMKPEDAKPATDDVRRLRHDMTRLHDVLVDVVADILLAAERNNK